MLAVTCPSKARNAGSWPQRVRVWGSIPSTPTGAPGDNRVKPDDLNELDRRILKEAFRQARKIQLRLKLDYQI